MTQDEIIRMAREARFISVNDWSKVDREFEHFYQMAFAAGVAHEREKIPKDFVKACEVLVKEKIDAVLAEREACAKVCEELKNYYGVGIDMELCAAAIRARNENASS